jgi:hypothetical protein
MKPDKEQANATDYTVAYRKKVKRKPAKKISQKKIF